MTDHDLHNQNQDLSDLLSVTTTRNNKKSQDSEIMTNSSDLVVGDTGLVPGTKDNCNVNNNSDETTEKNGLPPLPNTEIISVKFEPDLLTETTDLDSVEASSNIFHDQVEEDPGDSMEQNNSDDIESLENEILELDQLLQTRESEWNALIKLKMLKKVLLEQRKRRKEVQKLMDQDSSSNDGSSTEKQIPKPQLTFRNDKLRSSYSEIKDSTSALETQIRCTENEIRNNNSLNHNSTSAKRPRLDPFHLESRTASSALQKLANNRGKTGNRIIGEGRQGAIVDVQSIINNHRAKTATENVVNDPVKAKFMTPLNQSLQISYSDVLLTLAKISSQDSKPSVEPSPPTPVNSTLVKPSPRITNSSTNSSIKNRSSSNTTLAKLLSSNNSTPGTKGLSLSRADDHKNFIDENGATKFSQHQRLSVDNNISLNDLLSSGKNGKDVLAKPVPICQGCNADRAQFVCAGCANQWYCSRECQVGSWDVHSEVCTG